MKLHATPIHCQATMSQVICLGQVELSHDESDTLIRDINEFSNPALELFAHHGAWYCKNKLELKTTPLKKVVGRNLLPFFPTGKQSQQMQSLLTELQMLLHNHPINQQRRESEQPTVDGIWLWYQRWWAF